MSDPAPSSTYGAVKVDELIDSTGAVVRVNDINLSEASTNSSGYMSAGDKIRLDGMETGATADQTGAEIKTAYEAEDDTNALTDALKLKLEGLNQTDQNFTDADHTKLNGIETGATADQTGAEIKTAYENEADTNAFTDALKTKLDGLNATDENFTTAFQTKLTGIETGAQANTVDSVNSKTGAVTISAADLSLGNVDNTSDANKPVSSATQTALNAKADLVDGKLSESQLPDIAVTEFLGNVADETTMIAQVGQKGDWVVRDDNAKVYVITGTDPTQAGDWTALNYPAAAGTNLGTSTSTTAVSITSSTGIGTSLSAATATAAGAMTATDKSKLDGIATGANAFTKTSDLTNDSGFITSADGGNAATLDGIDSTAFLRSDESDQLDGDLVVKSNVGPLIQANCDSGTPWAFSIKRGDLSQESNVYMNSTSTGWTFQHTPSVYSGGAFDAIWHEGNDGAGSGLDADTVDGIQAANFVRSDVDDTFLGKITGEKLYLGGSAIDDTSAAKFQVQGFQRTGPIGVHEGGTGTNPLPTSEGGWISYNSGHLRFGGAATAADDKIWTEGNDGSGSGLDADTCDGQHLGTTADVTHNELHTTDWFYNVGPRGMHNSDYSGYLFQAGTSYWHLSNGGATNGGLIFYNQYNASHGGGTGRQGYVYWDEEGFGLLSKTGAWRVKTTSEEIESVLVENIELTADEIKLFGPVTTNSTIAGRDIATDGNKLDGIAAGANLVTKTSDLTNDSGFITSADGGNAATLDGIDSVNFVRSDINDTVSGRLDFFSLQDEKIKLSGSTKPSIRFQEGTTDKALLQFDGDNGVVYLENTESDTAIRIGSSGLHYYDGSTYQEVWHEGNDSALLRSDTDGTLSGNLTVTGVLDFDISQLTSI